MHVPKAIVLANLKERACATRTLRIRKPDQDNPTAAWFARHEMARTVEDVLARRTRLLFLDAQATLAVASDVAHELAKELGRDEAWERAQLADYAKVAQHFLPPR